MGRRWFQIALQEVNISAFIARLRERGDPVSEFLYGGLSKEEQLLITNYRPSAADARHTEIVCLEAVNRIMAGPCVYTDARFRDVVLGTESQSWMPMQAAPPGIYLANLNRCLFRMLIHLN